MAEQDKLQSRIPNAKVTLSSFAVAILGALSQAAWQESGSSCMATKLLLWTICSTGMEAWQSLVADPRAQLAIDVLKQAFLFIWPIFANFAAL